MEDFALGLLIGIVVGIIAANIGVWLALSPRSPISAKKKEE